MLYLGTIIARFAVIALFFDALAPILPRMANAYGLEDAQFQIIIGLAFIAFAVMQLGSVYLINYFDIRKVIFSTCLVVFLCAVLIALNSDPLVLLIFFVLMFAVNSVGSNATRVELRNVTEHETFKKIFSNTTGAVQLLQILTPILAGLIIATYGWSWALVAIVSPVGLVGLWLFLLPKNEEAAAGAKPKNADLSDVPDLFRMQGFLLPIAIVATFQIALAPVAVRLPFLLSTDMSATSETIGYVVAASHAVHAVSFFLMGYLVGKVEDIKLVFAGFLSLVAAGFLLYYAGSHSPLIALAGYFMVLASAGLVVTTCLGAALNIDPHYRALGSSVIGFVQPAVGGLSVLILGLSDLGNIDGMLVVVLASSLIMAPLLASLNISSKKQVRGC